MIDRRANLARQVRFLHNSKRVPEFPLNRFRAAPEIFKMFSLTRNFQMPASRKIAFNIFFAYHRFHAINRFQRSRIHPFSRLAPIHRNQLRRPQFQPAQHHSAVAAARAPANILCFQHRHACAAFRQRPRSRKARKSRTNHRHIHRLRQIAHRNLRRLHRRQPKILLSNRHAVYVTSVLFTVCPLS